MPSGATAPRRAAGGIPGRSGDAPMTQARCSGTTKAGAPCQATAPPGRAYCIAHDPERVTDLAEWRRKGGRASSNKARAAKALPAAAMTPVELQNFMIVVMKGTVAGKIDKGIANAAANLGRTIASLYGPATWEDRLAELERGDRGS